MQHANTRAPAIIRVRDLTLYLGLSRSSIYDRLNPRHPAYDPSFPQPTPLGRRSVGFIREEIDRWLDKQAAKWKAA